MSLTKVRNVLDVTADTMADLLSMKHKKGSVQLLGFHEKGDGGGGVFYWDADESTENHNGGTIIAGNKDVSEATWGVEGAGTWFDAPAVTTGCWKREFSGSVNVKWFGAKGDGVTDDTLVLNLLVLENKSVLLSGENYLFSGEYAPTYTPLNGSVTDNNKTYDYTIQTKESSKENSVLLQHRARLRYWSATSVGVTVPESLVMGGFRFFGSYKKPFARVVKNGEAPRVVVSAVTDLAVESAPTPNNWYAVFAVANKEDSEATFVMMPYLRCRTRTDNVIELAKGGEFDAINPDPQTYTFADNALVGAECLLVENSQGFLGAVTTITANTNSQITLEDSNNITDGSFVLPAPPGWDDYVYLASFYAETSGSNPIAVRNIADTGTLVNARMINIQSQIPDSGAISSWSEVSTRGLICPLAQSYVGRLIFSLQTTGTGAVAHNISHDSSNHDVWNWYTQKNSSGSETFQSHQANIAFSARPTFFIQTAGSLAGSISLRAMMTHGWIEL